MTLRPSRSIEQARELVEAELAALAEAEVGDDELRRVQNMRLAGFFFALEHIGGFGGVADRLNAYNVFRGDPGLIGDRRPAVPGGDRRRRSARSCQRHVAGKPRVELSVIGRKGPARARRAGPQGRTAAPRSRPASRAPMPEILRLRSGMPLWVFPRRDLPTVAGSIVIPGGGGLQRPEHGGLAQLTADMLDEGTRNRTAAQIAMAAEAMGASISASCGWDGIYVGFRCLEVGPASDPRPGGRHPAQPDVSRGGVAARPRPDARRPPGRAGQRRVARVSGPAPGPLRTGASLPIPAGRDRGERPPASTADDLKAFHDRYLVPGQATVVVAGDVDPEAVAEELDRRLAGWRGPEVALPRLADSGAVAAVRVSCCSTGRVRRRRSSGPATSGSLASTRPSTTCCSSTRSWAASSPPGSTRSSARSAGSPTACAASSNVDGSAGPFSIGTSVQSDRLAEALEDIRHEVAAILTGRPPTQDELDDARRSLDRGPAPPLRDPLGPGEPIRQPAGPRPPRRARGRVRRSAPGRIDRDSLIEAGRAAIHPDALVVVVVADAAQVLERLEVAGWARLERIED